MAKLGWVGSVLLAVGASAAASATQFGLGYGLGIISWAPTTMNTGATSDTVWSSSLAWTMWIAATATVIGAVCADRRSAGAIGEAPPRAGSGSSRAPGILATTVWRALLAVSSALGALVSVALVIVPARTAVVDTTEPQYIAAGYAVVGILLGIAVAVCALIARAAAQNIVITTSWLWVLAIACVVDGAASGRGFGTAPLAVWPFGDTTYFRSTWSLTGAALMLGAAFIIAIGAAWTAARRGDSRVGVSLSGGAGPLLVAIAYLLTAPHLVGVDDPHFSAYLIAPYALMAGLAGSTLLVAVLAGLDANRTAAKAPAPVLVPASDPFLDGDATADLYGITTPVPVTDVPAKPASPKPAAAKQSTATGVATVKPGQPATGILPKTPATSTSSKPSSSESSSSAPAPAPASERTSSIPVIGSQTTRSASADDRDSNRGKRGRR